MSEIVANKEPAIYQAIQEGFERINARATSNAQRVQKWVVLERDFSVAGGELGESWLFCLAASDDSFFRHYNSDKCQHGIQVFKNEDVLSTATF